VEYRRLATQLDDRSLTDKIKSFIDGLKPSLAAWVRYHNPKTVEDAFDIASRFESLQNQSNKSVTFFTAQSPDDRGKIICFYCNKPGHTKDVCKKRLREIGSSPRKSSFQSNIHQRSNRIICCFCNRPGHLGEDCKTAPFCSKCNKHGHRSETCRTQPSFMTLAQRSELPIISWVAKINGNQVIDALDNASHFSILSYRLAKRWHLELLESDNMIETSNGEKSQIIGKTKPMTVELENITAVISFTVTNLKAYDSHNQE